MSQPPLIVGGLVGESQAQVAQIFFPQRDELFFDLRELEFIRTYTSLDCGF